MVVSVPVWFLQLCRRDRGLFFVVAQILILFCFIGETELDGPGSTFTADVWGSRGLASWGEKN